MVAISNPEILREVGQQLTKERYLNISPAEQTELLIMLGVPINIDEPPSEEEYVLACRNLWVLQQITRGVGGG